MKTQEVPQPLRGFWGVFKEITYRWDYGEVFDDFLTLALCCFAHQTEEPLYFETIKKYDYKELDLFPKLLGEWLMMHDRQMRVLQWYDGLGEFYELLTSRYKSQRLGQFFTPQSVCDIMAQLNGDALANESEQTVNDPACGSGRFFLAMNAISKSPHLYIAQDIDFMCVKMTALNMMIHGLRGQVMHMDTIRMKYFTGFAINEYLPKYGCPSIIRMNPPKQSEQPKEEEKPKPNQFTLDF